MSQSLHGFVKLEKKLIRYDVPRNGQSTKAELPRAIRKFTTYLGQHSPSRERDRKVGCAEYKADGRDLICFPFSAEMFILIKITIRDYLVAFRAGSVKAAPG
jgi:hypothetical protein